jgi:2-polyprenyl-3-methyl-5-hydroxy-6-metoxy-1,4-benzoquinol methylase
MKHRFSEKLRCPRTLQRLRLKSGRTEGFIESDVLVSEDGMHHYPIRGGIPRFVTERNYAENFGLQWNRFSRTQLDSHSGQPISRDRFWKTTGWRPEEMKGKWVLDIGCGSGRFAEIALSSGANVIALDYSTAVDACQLNLGHHPNLQVVQGDVFALPLEPGSFDFVYSLGVLQHTPNPAAAFFALPPMIAPGGSLAIDIYAKRITALIHPKYLLRPITKRMKKETLFVILERLVPLLLPASLMLGKVPIAGPALKRIIPVANYDYLPLTPQQLLEWSLLDTFDWLAPTYDKPQDVHTIRRWMEAARMRDIELLQLGFIIARGTRPIKNLDQ